MPWQWNVKRMRYLAVPLLAAATALPGVSGFRATLAQPMGAERANQPLAIERANKARLLAQIGQQYAEAGQPKAAIPVLEQALRWTQSLSDDCSQARPLAAVAGGYLLAGQNTKGGQLLEAAFQAAAAETAARCSGSGTSAQESLLNRAVAHAENGHFNLARRMIEGVNNLFQPLALAQLAAQYAQAGQMEETTQVLDQAINLAQAQTDASNRPLLLIGIAASLEVAGQPQLVPPVLEQALVSTQAISVALSGEQVSSKSNHMLRIAQQLAAVGHEQQALKVLQQALPIVQTIPAAPFPLERVDQLVKLANQYSALAQKTQAKNTLALAQTAAQTIQDRQFRGYAFARLAEGYAVSNQFQRARQIASAIQDVNEREAAFRQIALAYLRAGQEEQALQLARSIGGQDATFTEMARYYLEQGQNDKALQLSQKQGVTGILSEVSLGYLKAEQPQQALQVAKLATGSESSLDWLLPAIAGGFAQRGDVDQALAIARGIKTPEYQVQALIQVAEELTAYQQRQSNPLQRIAVWLSNPKNLLFPRSGQSRAAAILDEALTLVQSMTPSPLP